MSERVFLASYRGIHTGWAGWVNRGIQLVDKTLYSHSEICVSTESPYDSLAKLYSSSGVDHGVRTKKGLLSRDKWDVVELPWVTPDSVIEKYLQTAEDPYDYLGTGRFLFPFLLREHPSRWFCSEWAAWAMGLEQPWRFTPAACHMVALSRGGVLI